VAPRSRGLVAGGIARSSQRPGCGAQCSTLASEVSAEYVTVVRGLFAEWNEHRGELTAEYFHPDIELDSRGLPQPDFQGVYHGLEGYARWASTWLSAWDNAQQYPVWVEGRNERVVAWVRLHLVGKLSGIGTDDLHGGWSFQFRDGKIVHIRLIVEEDEARGELGA
jgi:hypothetical protein